jgi:hypothetical protein
MNGVYQRITNNQGVRLLYGARWYFNLGIAQVSWVTGKLPELMAFLFLADYLGFPVPRDAVPPLIGAGVLALILLGWCWKHAGFYDTEAYVNARKDPVQAELLEAARIIKAANDRRKQR